MAVALAVGNVSVMDTITRLLIGRSTEFKKDIIKVSQVFMQLLATRYLP